MSDLAKLSEGILGAPKTVRVLGGSDVEYSLQQAALIIQYLSRRTEVPAVGLEEQRKLIVRATIDAHRRLGDSLARLREAVDGHA